MHISSSLEVGLWRGRKGNGFIAFNYFVGPKYGLGKDNTHCISPVF